MEDFMSNIEMRLRNGYRPDIIWQYKEILLTQPQKVIWSTTVLLLGIMIALSSLNTSDGESIGHCITTNLIVLIPSIAFQVWIQNKLWSETFKFQYPKSLCWSKKVNGDESPLDP